MTVPQRPAPTAHGPAKGSKRLLAYLIDVLVVLATAVAAYAFRPSPVLVSIIVVEVVAVLTVILAATGRSPGLLATRCAMARSDSGLAPGLLAGFLHVAVLVLAHLTVIGPAIGAILTEEGRTWIDRISRTRVVDLTADADEDRTSATSTPYAAPNRRPQSPPLPGVGAGNLGFGAVTPAPPGAHHSPAAPTFQPPSAQRPAPSPAAPVPAVPPVPATSSAPQAPAIPPPAENPVRTAARLWAIMDTGQREPIDATIVIGRAPTSADPSQRLVAVVDSTRSLSRTHLRIGPARSGAWVEDAFSANGTSARLPDGRVFELPRGERRTVPAGTVLLMGERTLHLAAEDTAPADH